MKPAASLVNLVRGVLIGTAEVIPGVSGGTVALIVGVYEVIIQGVADFVYGLGHVIRGNRLEAVVKFKAIRFGVLLPILFGMVVAIFTVAALIEPLLIEYPQITRATFAGLLLASLAVPFGLVAKSLKPAHVFAILAGAALAFWLTSLPTAGLANPAGWQIVLFAAVAICALVLPGVSGSFFLLAVGLYAPTIAAVNDRDFGYLALFVFGAVMGLFSFALFMRWLLLNYRSLILSLMIGLMIGSLRALWPWQTESRELLAPSDAMGPVVAAIVGFGVVAVIILVERSISSRQKQ